MQDRKSNNFAWNQRPAELTASQATWERSALNHLHASTFTGLLEALTDEDPNMRIVAAQLMGSLHEGLDPHQLGAAVDGLIPLLADPAVNEYEYGSWQSDEESLVTVSDTAANALVQLGYADNAAAVFDKARENGIATRDTGRPQKPR